jgi:hypothetical protein
MKCSGGNCGNCGAAEQDKEGGAAKATAKNTGGSDERTGICRKDGTGNRRRRHRPCRGFGIWPRGAAVVVSDAASGPGEETALLVTLAGGRALFIQADVASKPEVAALVARVVAAYGRPDCAFNNAGIEEEQSPLAECDEQLFDRIMRVNVKARGYAWSTRSARC